MPERMVKCVKLQRELPGLDRQPFKAELGQRVYESVSKDAWKMFKEHFKMVMNEYRLALGTEEANQIFEQQVQDYFFGPGAALPPGYVPPQTKS
jgi:Fe-S cluster biosynthesis and repair protein YggX